MSQQLPLSAVNYKTWVLIAAHVEKFGYAPTITELAKAFDVAQSVIGRRLNKLQASGWITRERYKSRSIRVIYPQTETKVAA